MNNELFIWEAPQLNIIDIQATLSGSSPMPNEGSWCFPTSGAIG